MHAMRWLLRCSLGLLACWPATVVAAPQTIAFPAVALARIAAAAPDRPLLGAPLEAAGTGAHAIASLLRFEVRGLPAPIRRVHLEVFVTGASTRLPHVLQTQPDWEEAIVTWRSRPNALVEVVGDPQPVRKGQWLSLEVTPVVPREGRYSFCLRAAGGAPLEFAGRAPRDTVPRLVVTWDDGLAVDDVAPGIFIASPSEGAAVSGPFAVDVQASDDAGVARVDLWLDDRRHQTLHAAPYQFTLDATHWKPGRHALRIEATDAAGNRGADTLEVVVVTRQASGRGRRP